MNTPVKKKSNLTLLPSLMLGLGTVGLGGCATLSELKMPAMPQMPWIKSKDVKSVTLVQIDVFKENQQWWQVFQDPLLDQFANQILAENIDLKIARARLTESRALVTSTRSGLFPDVAGNVSASRGDNNSNNPQSLGQAGFDASWELDLFGQVRSTVNAAESRALARTADIEDIRNTIVADLARAVIQWRQAMQTIAETNSLLESQQDQIDLLTTRAEIGLIDTSFAERAKAQRAKTATELPLAKAAAETAQYQIEKLLNCKDSQVADALAVAMPQDITVPEPKPLLEFRSDSLKNRPDIASAKASLLAAQADLSKAEAGLWPKISLSAFFGVQEGTDSIRVASNPIWSLASAVTAPVLNFERLNSAVDASDSRAEQSSLAYENIVLQAVQETKTALSDYLNGINAVAAQAETLQYRRETIAIVRERFDRGLTDMTDLTTAQAELDQDTLALITQKANTAIAYISLQKSLGIASNAIPNPSKVYSQ